jgi:YbbR domain-containing protein
MSGVFRWVIKNLGTLLLAFVLAAVVWVSAVMSADPNEERVLAREVPIETIGQNPALQIMGDPESAVRLTMNAPQSVWSQLNGDISTIRAWIDLAGLGSGTHTLPVQVQIRSDLLVRLVRQEPESVVVAMEALVTRVFEVTPKISGETPTGYQTGTPIIDPPEVTISGPESTVDKVKEVRVLLDISGASQTVTKTVAPIARDASGRPVTGLTIAPDQVTITQPIELLGGFRYVIVKAVPDGQVANGYKLTNILVSPPGVVVFSSDPQEVNALPGYVETEAIDLTGADDDFETLVELNLPEGISVVGDSKVLVQVSIAAIESSLAVSLPVDIIGLTPGLEAEVAPTSVDVILAGPVPELDALEPSDVRVKVDLTGYEVGTFQVIPIVDLLSERLRVVSIIPPTVEVIITLAPTPTPTPTVPPTETPTPTPTLSP